MLGGIPWSIWQHSPKYLSTFSGMFDTIPLNVWLHSPEFLTTFSGMFEEIPWNVQQHFPECLVKFPGILHSHHSPRSSHSVPRSFIPGFIHSLYFQDYLKFLIKWKCK